MAPNMRARASIVNTQETETPARLIGDGVTDDTDAVCWYITRSQPLPPTGSYLVDPHKMASLVPEGFAFGLGTP